MTMAAKKIVIAKIQNSCGVDGKWEPYEFHRVHPDQVGQRKHWWAEYSEGIHLLGGDGPLRTKGQPVTLRRIAKSFGDILIDQDRGTAKLIAATIAVESVGNPLAERYEKHLNDFSIGLTQTLTATAHALAKKMGDTSCPSKPIPKGGSIEEWRRYLRDPEVSMRLAIAYYADVDKRWNLKRDAILNYAAFNAGSPRPSKRLPWGLVYYDPDMEGPKPGSLDRFAAWYGDACAVDL